MNWSGLINPVEMNDANNFLKRTISDVKGKFSQNAILFSAANCMTAGIVRRSRRYGKQVFRNWLEDCFVC